MITVQLVITVLYLTKIMGAILNCSIRDCPTHLAYYLDLRNLRYCLGLPGVSKNKEIFTQ